MTAYTRVFDVDPGSPNRSRSVEAEFDLVAAGFATVEAASTATGVSTAASFAQVAVQIKRGYRDLVGATTAVSSDRGTLLSCSGTFTLSLAAAATLGDGWFCVVRNAGSGNITIDPNGAETIDGLSTGVVYPGFAFLVSCTGALFQVQKVAGHRIERLTSGTSWTCPMGVTFVRGQGVGSGGGGGRGSSTTTVAPGGPGAYSQWEFTTTPGTTHAYSIGASAGLQITTGTVGISGSSTTFNTNAGTITMPGGSGGGISATTSSVIRASLATGGGLNHRSYSGLHSVVSSGNTLSIGGSTPLGSGGSFDVNSGVETDPSGYGGGGFGGSSTRFGGSSGPGVIFLEF